MFRSWLGLAALTLVCACGSGEERDAERGRINAECATIRTEMQQRFAAFAETAVGEAEEPGLRASVERELAMTVFRNPDPCFGHAEAAIEVPGQFSGELEARFATLEQAYSNAGAHERYIALEPARVQSEILQEIDRIRDLATRYAATAEER